MKKILTMLLAGAIMFTPTVHAKNSTRELFQVYGSSLNEQERQIVNDEFLSHLELEKDNTKIETATMTNKDMERLLGYPEGSSSGSNMLSNVQIEKLKDDSGVFVEIISPENITVVSEMDYMNAAITAGLKDSHILVTSLKPATGEAALSGIYMSAELSGVKLNEQLIKNANDELVTVNKIVTENKDNNEFKSEEFRKVITVIKQDIINQYENNDNSINVNQINNIITNNLNEHHITVTPSQQEELNQIFGNFGSQIKNMDRDELRVQLNRLTEYTSGAFENVKDYINSDKFQEGFDSLKKGVTDTYKSAEDAGVFAKLGEFFSTLWNWFIGLFK